MNKSSAESAEETAAAIVEQIMDVLRLRMMMQPREIAAMIGGNSAAFFVLGDENEWVLGLESDDVESSMERQLRIRVQLVDVNAPSQVNIPPLSDIVRAREYCEAMHDVLCAEQKSNSQTA